jgi:RNA polymerase sigma factor (sigma-70 family)
MATANLSVFLRHLRTSLAAEALNNLSDQQLLQRFLDQGNESAFEAIIRRHGPMVLRVCWRELQQSQDAEDAFQAAFMLLACQARSIRKPNSLASWLHGVAHRIALKVQAQRATRRRHEEMRAQSWDVARDEGSRAELWSLLDEELRGLPEKWRLPLILCYHEGKTQDEAATQLNWSTRTFRRRLNEARAALGRRLARRGIAWSAALGASLLSDCVVAARLPAGLTAPTVEAAVRIAAGRTVAGIVSTHVTALMGGVGNTMFTNKLKIVAAVVLLALTTGVCVLVVEGLAAQPINRSAQPQEAKSTADISPKPVGGAPVAPEKPANQSALPEAAEMFERLVRRIPPDVDPLTIHLFVGKEFDCVLHAGNAGQEETALVPFIVSNRLYCVHCLRTKNPQITVYRVEKVDPTYQAQTTYAQTLSKGRKPISPMRLLAADLQVVIDRMPDASKVSVPHKIIFTTKDSQ